MADMENPTCHVAFFRTSMDAEVLSACDDIAASRGYSGPAAPATELFDLIHLLRPDFSPDLSRIEPTARGVRCDVLLARIKGSRTQVYLNISTFESLVNPKGHPLFKMDSRINSSTSTIHATTAYVPDLNKAGHYTRSTWGIKRTPRTAAACSPTAVFSVTDDLSVGFPMTIFDENLYSRSPEWAKYESRLGSWNLADFSDSAFKDLDPRIGIDPVADAARGGFPSYWSHVAAGPQEPVVYSF